MHFKQGTAVIAEKHDFYSAGLGGLLTRKAGLKTIVKAKSIEQAAAALSEAPDALLLTIDAALPGMEGAETIRSLRRQFPTPRMVLVSNFVDRDIAFMALSAGAHGVILRSASPAEILIAFKALLSGQIFIPAAIADTPQAERSPNDGEDRNGAGSMLLTPRQAEIVSLLSEGHSNKAIARALGISPSTVKVHLHAAFRALGVHNRVSAVCASRSLTQPIHPPR